MKIKNECLICGKEFEVKPSTVKKGGGRFCSRKCMEKWRSNNHKGENNPNWKGGGVEKICQFCVRKFTVKLCEIHKGRGVFCSRKCYGNWRSENKRGKNNISWKGGKVKTKCLVCGKICFGFPSETKSGRCKFCSTKCYGEWQSKNKKNENSPLWKGGKAEMKCMVCGKYSFIYPAVKKQGRGRFCSRSCSSIWTVKHSKKKNTSIELKVKEYLDRLGVKYEEQKMIPEGRTVVDFYIQEQHLVLYADGSYWHSRPGAKDRDCRQDFLLGFNGYNVLRLGEHEINLKPKLCLRKIRDFGGN